MRTLGIKGAMALIVALLAAAAFAGGALAQKPDDPGKSESAPGHNKDATTGAQGQGNGPAQEPPGCNGTIHLGSGPGTDPKYSRSPSEPISVRGSGFDAPETFDRWTIVDVNDGSAPIASDTNDWSAADGTFSFTAIMSGDARLVDDHEYKLTVYWFETLPNGTQKECHKSKNFFLTGSAQAGGGGGGGGGSGGGGTPGGGTPGGGTPGGGNPSGGTTPPTTGSNPSVGGVAGVEETKTTSGKSPLRKAGRAAGGVLPFTGVPAWFYALMGLGLAAAGFGLRRAAELR